MKKGLLDRLKEGFLVCDGSFVVTLEKRGYVKAGPWTPEASAEHPEAVKQLHREFLRAGSDIMTTFTFYSADDKLHHKDNTTGDQFTCKQINECACKIAREVADEGNALVGGSISQNPCYTEGKGKAYEQDVVRKQIEFFKKGKVDFLLLEYIFFIEEMEWCIEVSKDSGLPVVATMSIGPEGDHSGVSPGECAVRMAKAGAHVVGLNCSYDPQTIIHTIKMMKKSLDEAGLEPYLMTQPNGFHTSGAPRDGGWLLCPEYPYGLETRTITRMEAAKYARAAYDAGVRIIGGCCGFEAYHIRAISEELYKERKGYLPPGSDKSCFNADALKYNVLEAVRQRASKEYWDNLVPNTGRRAAPTYPLPAPTYPEK